MKIFKKDKLCCMCGYKFKSGFEKNNPEPYPKRLYLKNDSSRCCPKCNGLVLAMRSSEKLSDYIRSIAKNNQFNDSQKKKFCDENYKCFGERFYLESEYANRVCRAMNIEKSIKQLVLKK